MTGVPRINGDLGEEFKKILKNVGVWERYSVVLLIYSRDLILGKRDNWVMGKDCLTN